MRQVFWPLAGMTLLQTVSVILFLAVPVMAPVVARDLGIDASAIGAYTSIVFLVAMFVSAGIGTVIRRYGAIRTVQVGLLLSALALLLTTSGTLAAVLVGAVLIGLGYGPNTPAGSHVLARVTPANMRGLVFSIKQSGAPLGGMLTGLIIPPIAAGHGWQAAAWAATAMAVVGAVLVQPLRARCDDDRRPDQRLSMRATWSSLRLLLANRPLRRLTVASFAYSSLQICVFSVLVAYLVEVVGLDLVTAGIAFAAMQIAGVVARVAWGWLADQVIAARPLLTLIGIAGALLIGLLTQFTSAWPFWAIAAVCAAVGATVAGWNGVFLAEVARIAPDGQVGAATGGTLFFTYFGLVVGPASFTALVAATGSYATAFQVIAAVSLLSALAQYLPARPATGAG